MWRRGKGQREPAGASGSQREPAGHCSRDVPRSRPMAPGRAPRLRRSEQRNERAGPVSAGRVGSARARTRPPHRELGWMAGRGPVPAGFLRADLAAVGRSRGTDGGRQPRGHQPVRLVHAGQRDRGLAWPAPGPGHDRPERAAGHQPDVEYIGPAAWGPAGSGDAAGRPADQPDHPADGRLRRFRGQPVLGAAALGSRACRGGDGRRGVRVLARPAGRRDRALPSAVRRAAAADHRRAAGHPHRPGPLCASRPLARPAGRRAVVYRGRTAGRSGRCSSRRS